jgi:hypothetical protein
MSDKDVVISREVYEFLMGEGPLEGVWFNDLHKGLPGRFWWRGLLACSAGWPAKADRSRNGQDRETGLGSRERRSRSDLPKSRSHTPGDH